MRLHLLLAIALISAFAQTLPPGVEKRATVGGIAEYSFPRSLSSRMPNRIRNVAGEVTTAKKAFQDQQKVQRPQDAALVRVLASREQSGKTMQWDQELEPRIQSLTPDQINTVFRNHIDAAGLSIVKAGDFQKAAVFQ